MNEDWFVRERKIFTLIKKCCVITVREFGCTTAEGELFLTLSLLFTDLTLSHPLYSPPVCFGFLWPSF